MRIGVDIMGGDFFPAAPVEGAVRARRSLGDKVSLYLIGQEKLILEELARHQADPAEFVIVHTDEYIGMHEKPTRAIQAKPMASINLGIGMLREQKLDAFLSAGNTGAMLVASMLGLGPIPGVQRPTIATLIPRTDGGISLLCDVGANLDCKPEWLRQFGILGSLFMQKVLGVESPRVALLNVGEEEGKGGDVVQQAYALMKEDTRIQFAGNAEGRDIFRGFADVYVCDGFTGNILLKFGESMYDVLKARYQQDEFMEKFNFENYGGVPVLGLRGISMIGHGISNGKAIESMIRSAMNAAASGLTEQVRQAFAETSEQQPG